MRITSRKSIPEIYAAVVDREMHNLGIVKMFAAHPDLANFAERYGGSSLSWVHLEPGQELAPHRHPEPTMIVICDGEGVALGDAQRTLQAGDIVTVGAGRLHGFRGAGLNGFWGLSIQFEGKALYSEGQTPNVIFKQAPKSGSSVALNTLRRMNSEWSERFSNSPLVRLVRDGQALNASTRDRLLDCLQGWSHFFQRLLAARVASAPLTDYGAAAREHLEEEFNHDMQLLAQRGGKPAVIQDPAMEAIATWFLHRMLTGSEAEKVVLMHLVLEESSRVFHSSARDAFADMDHFRLHEEADEDHTEAGFQLLERNGPLDLSVLAPALDTGWRMMQLICDRMSELAQEPSAFA